VPASFARLMRASGAFRWLPKVAHSDGGALQGWYRTGTTTVFCHCRLSTYGYQEQKKRDQIGEIRSLVEVV